MICVKDLSFAYGDKKIFTDVNLNFNEGRMYCLVGPNGCGKSTFIDCLLHLNDNYTGTITIDGRDSRQIKASELARKISYVPQVHERSFPYTVMQIVLMGRTAYNGIIGPNAKDVEMAEYILEEIGLFSMKDRPYTQISGGEMQLVMLARALMQETSIIIMDEPTAHLDFRNELIFMEAVIQLVNRRKVTCILVTHSPDQPFYFEERLNDVQIVAFCNGNVSNVGLPSDAMSEEFLREVFGVKAMPIIFEKDGIQFRRIIPIGTV